MFHILLYCILYTWILLADNRWPVGAGFTCNICTLPQPEQENDQHPSVGLWCASFRYRTPVQAGWQPVAPPMSRHFHRVRSVTHTRKFTAHTHTHTQSGRDIGTTYVLIQHVHTHVYTYTGTHADGEKRTRHHHSDDGAYTYWHVAAASAAAIAVAAGRAGGQACGRPAGLWESPLRWPATGSDVRRGVRKVRSRPVRSIHEPCYTLAFAVRVPGRRALYSF